ncbi:hypothetical protein Cflav_PD1974 [Pedosphaera parvula Ellin514]|uniref:Uncharacterized protein n=1 Tax=Pedosphaera parvula (strain Ellin514) TaxID=320771 RepID=B9XN05_PEDPL|nr:hypothetical protein Cflav_PD1974 [Pedosphaera parvula Ellin514]
MVLEFQVLPHGHQRHSTNELIAGARNWRLIWKMAQFFSFGNLTECAALPYGLGWGRMRAAVAENQPNLVS